MRQLVLVISTAGVALRMRNYCVVFLRAYLRLLRTVVKRAACIAGHN